MHITDEKIAELIESKISKKDLKVLIKHTSKCNDCFELVSESVDSYQNLKYKNPPSPKQEIILKAEKFVSTEGSDMRDFNIT